MINFFLFFGSEFFLVESTMCFCFFGSEFFLVESKKGFWFFGFFVENTEWVFCFLQAWSWNLWRLIHIGGYNIRTTVPIYCLCRE